MTQRNIHRSSNATAPRAAARALTAADKRAELMIVNVVLSALVLVVVVLITTSSGAG